MTGKPPKPSCHFSIKPKKPAYSISSRRIKHKSSTSILPLESKSTFFHCSNSAPGTAKIHFCSATTSDKFHIPSPFPSPRTGSDSNATSDKCSTVTVPLPLNSRTMAQLKSVVSAVNSFSKVCVVPFADAEPFRYSV